MSCRTSRFEPLENRLTSPFAEIARSASSARVRRHDPGAAGGDVAHEDASADRVRRQRKPDLLEEDVPAVPRDPSQNRVRVGRVELDRAAGAHRRPCSVRSRACTVPLPAEAPSSYAYQRAPAESARSFTANTLNGTSIRVVPAVRSRMYTSGHRSGAQVESSFPGARFVASDVNVTYRPSGEMASAREELRVVALHLGRRHAHALGGVRRPCRERTRRARRCRRPGTRFDASEAKATKRPFADTATVPPPLPPFASTAAERDADADRRGRGRGRLRKERARPDHRCTDEDEPCRHGHLASDGERRSYRAGQFVCNRTISVHPLINRLAVA